MALHRLPINIWKCHLLYRILLLLGVVLFEKCYQLGCKLLKWLIALELPQALSQLRGLMGRLEHANHFIPDYHHHMKPLQKLLEKDGSNWTEEHMAALNILLELTYQRIKLDLVDFLLLASIIIIYY